MIDTKPYRRALGQYFYSTDWHFKNTISKIEVDRYAGDKIVVTITTHMPGILIGKAGSYINGLIGYMKEEFNDNIEIKLLEEKMWVNLWG